MTELVASAFQRLVDALNTLNRGRDEAALRAAVSDDVRIERYRPGARGVATIAETFSGAAEVARWFARTPPVVVFSLASAPRGEPDGSWAIDYALDAGAFHNGGVWRARLAGDGRIASLAHHPFALTDER